MNRITAVVLALGSAALGYYLRTLMEQPVRPLAPYRFADELSDPKAGYLSARGTWHGAELANRINTVRIECWDLERKCEMHQADVYGFTGPYLDLHTTGFRIVQLDGKTLTAVNTFDTMCVRQMLVIDRHAKSVSFVRTKIGQDTLCAAVQSEPLTLYLGDPKR